MVVCSGCGTAFDVEAVTASRGPLAAAQTPLGIAVVTGLGVGLICGALFMAAGFAALQLKLLPGRPPPGEEKIYTFFYSLRPAPFIALAAILPTVALCRARCQQRPGPGATASVTLSVLMCAALLPSLVPAASFFWCVPASLLGMGSGAAGCYLGATIQVAAGAWVLVWLRPR